jgi:hypothetical protein
MELRSITIAASDSRGTSELWKSLAAACARASGCSLHNFCKVSSRLSSDIGPTLFPIRSAQV